MQLDPLTKHPKPIPVKESPCIFPEVRRELESSGRLHFTHLRRPPAPLQLKMESIKSAPHKDIIEKQGTHFAGLVPNAENGKYCLYSRSASSSPCTRMSSLARRQYSAICTARQSRHSPFTSFKSKPSPNITCRSQASRHTPRSNRRLPSRRSSSTRSSRISS